MGKVQIGEGTGHMGADAYAALARQMGGTGAFRTGYGTSTVPAAEIRDELQSACEDFEYGLVRSRHTDRYIFCDELAGHYMALTDLDPFGDEELNGKVRDAFVTAALEAKGMSMDLSGLYDGDLSKNARDRLADEMAGRLEIDDPEVASAWMDQFEDGAKRDAYGRRVNRETGRPYSSEYAHLALASPGVYLARMKEDNERIVRKREDAFRDAYESIGLGVPVVPLMSGPAPEPDAAGEKPGMWEKLKGMLGGKPEEQAGNDGPEY